MQSPCHASTICRICSSTVSDMKLKYILRGTHYIARGVLKENRTLRGIHQSKKISRLFPMIVVDAVIPMVGGTLDRARRFSVLWLVVPEPFGIWIVVLSTAEVSVGTHFAITVIRVEWTFGGIDRNMVEIYSETISLSVSIREESSLQ